MTYASVRRTNVGTFITDIYKEDTIYDTWETASPPSIVKWDSIDAYAITMEDKGESATYLVYRIEFVS